jgi:protein O-GlcNAc transferase
MLKNGTLDAAAIQLRAGNFDQAQRILEKIVKKQPENIPALNMLGMLSYQLHKYDSAIQYMKRVVRLQPQNSRAYYVLGHSLQEKGKVDEAVDYYQEALKLDPGLADIYYNLGTIYHDKKKIDEAVAFYGKALQINPRDIDACYNLGNILQENGRLDEAVTYYQKALQLDPGLVDVYSKLGLIYNVKKQYDEAINSYRQAVRINPSGPAAYYGLGTALAGKGRLEDAILVYRKALQMNPSDATAYYYLGYTLLVQGMLNEGETSLRRSIQIDPDVPSPYQSLLQLMSYSKKYDAQTVLSEHLYFDKHFAEPLLPAIIPHSNICDTNRKLRVGYVSPNFRRHSVCYFIEPVLRSHDRGNFEIYCYSDVLVEDEVTRRIQTTSHQWRKIAGMSDQTVSGLIREDGIDVLVDLAGHTNDNRMLVFARKPAPVQLSWIGYPGTTGLSTMDYKIVDNYTDPPGMTEHLYSETLLRLPDCFLCYLPFEYSPNVGSPPALSSGYITFGSFNNFTKISSEVVKIWSEILRLVPDSRLVLKSFNFLDEKTRGHAMDMFAREGIITDRVESLPPNPSIREHLETYNHIDIALDTFPYNGTTTTCEALWMGVPVVALAGETHVSRVGVSLLSNVGLPELVTPTPEAYVEIATELARNIHRLDTLRGHLRDTMAHSRLTDAKRFTAGLESCYHTIWDRWCCSRRRSLP